LILWYGSSLSQLECRTGTVRYTFNTVRRAIPVLFVVFSAIPHLIAVDQSFSRVKVPDSKGKPVNAVLTFSDQKQAVEIRPTKVPGLTIPYSRIYKFSYEYTKRHRVSEGTLATAPLGIGALMMLTKGRSHWLQIDYDDPQNVRKFYVLRMDKHDYLRILEAVKAHTGKDADVLGNANKR